MSENLTFDELLKVFWLRPETALWREIDIQTMKTFEFTSPSLDIGCGDGIFSFIRAGGTFHPSFDAFRSMGNMNAYFDNADVFDYFDENLDPTIIKKPDYQIDWAIDHKENLLKKAAKLKLHKNFKVADANLKLPFEDGTFNSIFSNIIYWLEDPKAVISEISRILKPGGKACLMLPNSSLPEYSFYNQNFVKNNDSRWSFLEKLDRGRFADNLRLAKKDEDWEKMFEAAGLKIHEHKTHLSKTVIQMWDVGLRPIFPVLLKMANAIPSERFLELKQEWVETVKEFLLPLVKIDDSLCKDSEPAFHLYILEK